MLALCSIAKQSVHVRALPDSPAPIPMKPKLPPPKPQPTPKPQPAPSPARSDYGRPVTSGELKPAGKGASAGCVGACATKLSSRGAVCEPHRSRLRDHGIFWLPSGVACLGWRPRVRAEARPEHVDGHDHAMLTVVSLQEKFKAEMVTRNNTQCSSKNGRGHRGGVGILAACPCVVVAAFVSRNKSSTYLSLLALDEPLQAAMHHVVATGHDC